MLVLAETVLGTRSRARRGTAALATVGKVARATRTGSTRSRSASPPGSTPAGRPRPTCARSSHAVRRPRRAAAPSPRSPGPPRPASTRALRDRLADVLGGRSAAPCCPPAPATTPASSPRPASRRRCCSCATRPASPTRRPSTPSADDCLAGVDALAAVLADLAVTPVTGYWCEHAWLPTAPRPACASTVDDGRFAAVDGRRRAAAGRRAAARRCAARLRQRAQPRLPPRAARPHPRRAAAPSGPGGSRCTPSPSGSTRTPTSRSPGPPTPRWRWPGSPRRRVPLPAPRPGGRPYADPNAMGDALSQAAAEAGVRLTLLDTCYLGRRAGRHGHPPLDPVQHRFGDGDAAALGRAGRPAAGRRRAAHRRRDPLGAGRAGRPAARGSPAAAPGRPLHVHLSEQPAENEACLAYYGCTPDRAARRARRARAAHHGGARHPPDRRRHRAARRDRHRRLLLPDAPSATWPTASARPGALRDAGSPAVPRQRPARGRSTCSRRRARSSCTSGWPAGRARPIHPGRAGRRAHRATGTPALGWPDAGRIAAGRGPTWSPCASTARVRPAADRRRQVVLAATRRRRRHGGRRRRAVVTDGRAPARRRRHAAGAARSSPSGAGHDRA